VAQYVKEGPQEVKSALKWGHESKEKKRGESRVGLLSPHEETQKRGGFGGFHKRPERE